MIELFLKLVYLFANVAFTYVYYLAWNQNSEALKWNAESGLHLHVASASIGAMILLFSNLFMMFYFIGTGLWIKDQSRKFSFFDKEKAMNLHKVYEKANHLKGKAFPGCALTIVFCIFTYVMGAANQIRVIPHWLHPLLATVILVSAWFSIFKAFSSVHKNMSLLDNASDIIEGQTLKNFQ